MISSSMEFQICKHAKTHLVVVGYHRMTSVMNAPIFRAIDNNNKQCRQAVTVPLEAGCPGT